MRQRSLISVVCALAVLVPAGTVGAHDPDEHEARLERVESRLERTRSLLRGANRERRGLVARIAESDLRRNDLSARILGLSDLLAQARERLTEVQDSLGTTRVALRRWSRRLDHTSERLGQQQETLGDRAAAVYKLGPSGFLDVVLGAHDLRSLADSVQFVRTVLQEDNALLTSIRVTRAQTESQRSTILRLQGRLLEQRKRVQAEVERVAALKAEQEALRAEVEREIAVRKALLDDIERSRARYLAAVEELEAESARIEGLIRSGGSSGSGQHDGELFWPTSGPIVSGFGWRTHPILGTRRFHSGVDIDGACGQAIWAADGGRVLSAGWKGGYGLTTVVDHGGGLATLYAHQSGISVSGGQGVSRGQVIGSVGTTGWSTGCHLHFEVRVNGSPVDPVPYLT